MNAAHELQPSPVLEHRSTAQEMEMRHSNRVPHGWRKLHQAAVTLDASKVPQYASEMLWEFFGAQSKLDEELSTQARTIARSMGRNRTHICNLASPNLGTRIRGQANGLRANEYGAPTRKRQRVRVQDHVNRSDGHGDDDFAFEPMNILEEVHLRWFDWTNECLENKTPPWEADQTTSETDEGIKRRAPGFRDLKRPPKTAREFKGLEVDSDQNQPCWTESAVVYTTENGTITERLVMPVHAEGADPQSGHVPKKADSSVCRSWPMNSRRSKSLEDAESTSSQRRSTRRMSSRDGPPTKGGSND